nr:ubiquitin carboxyl-terminal hydrolase 48-like isoform X1 [Procambarus clarkii]XP_045624249.1 ubiquitin carboxyl-terminal hydrolase 48-like isoform X1 [Procambarus clarkii]
MKEKISNDLSYIKAGYRSDKWKWVLSLPMVNGGAPVSTLKEPKDSELCGSTVKDDASEDTVVVEKSVSDSSDHSQTTDTFVKNSEPQSLLSTFKPFSEDQLTKEQILKTYGMDKSPKTLPCQKRCSNNPWCLADLRGGAGKVKVRPTDQPRDQNKPVGLQNTANTCWINSALQALFHLPKFRNVINAVDGFADEESLSCMLYLLQAMFVEMDTHANKAIACSPGSVFERMGLFATQEIMRKDADHEVLKCVSEFLENTIDTLIADPKLGSELRPLFNTNLMRLARWKCPVCETEHENHLAPATSYTMAAYVSGDECPLDQCLVDLQTETQTGVSLVCGSDSTSTGGCGARVKADRIVTPKIQNLPAVLVIRNNSLMDRDLKRRLHVVYPEILDLTSHTLNHVAATYTLSAVIFHHGHWVKHFSAHVKTRENKWFNFNDEQVSELTSRSTGGNPSESHRNYFSIANVANKYKHRSGLRVSRGAFVWIYVRSNISESEETHVPPPESIVEYVLKKQEESMTVNHQRQAEMRKEKEELLSQLAVVDMSEDYSLISEPLLSAWFNDDDLHYIPQPSVLAQVLCEHKLFNPLKFHLIKCVRTEGVKAIANHQSWIHQDEALLKLGLPLSLQADTGCCKHCILKAANHILFIERVKALHKQAKKDARREHDRTTKVIGLETLEFWPRLALSAYVKEHGIDIQEEAEENVIEINKKTEDNIKNGNHIVGCDTKVDSSHVNGDGCEKTDKKTESDGVVISSCDTTNLVPETDFKIACDSRTGNVNIDLDLEDKDEKVLNNLEKNVCNSVGSETKEGNSEIMLFNEDIVCNHNLLSPTAYSCKIPEELALEIMKLCGESIHPAIYQEDFNSCPDCGTILEESMRTCSSGRQQKKQLSNLFVEKKRPHPTRDPGKQIFLVSRNFMAAWKTYIRACERGDLEVTAPAQLENAPLLCTHNQLLFPVFSLQPHQMIDYLVLVWEEEWDILKEHYPPDHIISASYSDAGLLLTQPSVCESGCVEVRAAQDYEDQFSYEHQIIHVRQVNSVNDIPRRSGRSRGAQAPLSLALTTENMGPRSKKPRLASQTGGGAGGSASSSASSSNQRLVRASKTFSSTDTLREVQIFIAARTGIWPMLQTLWICGEEVSEGVEEQQPLQLTDDHCSMTLNALRVRPGDTIYFRAAVEDMERAAGDGVMEFNEIDDEW